MEPVEISSLSSYKLKSIPFGMPCQNRKMAGNRDTGFPKGRGRRFGIQPEFAENTDFTLRILGLFFYLIKG
jgi:hypothetical protein